MDCILNAIAVIDQSNSMKHSSENFSEEEEQASPDIPDSDINIPAAEIVNGKAIAAEKTEIEYGKDTKELTHDQRMILERVESHYTVSPDHTFGSFRVGMGSNASPIPLGQGEQYWHFIQAKSGQEWGNANLFPGVWLEIFEHVVTEDEEVDVDFAPVRTVLFGGLILKAQLITLIGLVDGVDVVTFSTKEVAAVSDKFEMITHEAMLTISNYLDSRTASAECKKCGYKSKNKSTFSRHKCNRCTFLGCEECFPNKAALLSHTESQHAFGCAFCACGYADQETLDIHVRDVHQDVQECRFCQEWVQESKLELHYKKSHKYSCSECEGRFRFSRDLKKHAKQAHLDVEKRETNVKKNSKNKSNKVSKRKKNSDNLVTVDLCDEADGEQKKATGAAAAGATPQPANSGAQKGTAGATVQHSKSRSTYNDALYSCDVCSQSFSDLQALVEHVRNHVEIPCGNCPMTFSKASLWINHQQEHAAKEKQHEGKKPQVHAAEEDEERIYCQQCDATFTRQSSLTRHMRSHSGEKFRCPLCEYETSVKSNLVRHMPQHANDELEEQLGGGDRKRKRAGRAEVLFLQLQLKKARGELREHRNQRLEDKYLQEISNL